MISDREHDRGTDVGAIWFGHGVELAQRMEKFIADRREHHAPDPGGLLDDLEALLLADYDPRPSRPDLGHPLRLRPAVPPRPEPGA